MTHFPTHGDNVGVSLVSELCMLPTFMRDADLQDMLSCLMTNWQNVSSIILWLDQTAKCFVEAILILYAFYVADWLVLSHIHYLVSICLYELMAVCVCVFNANSIYIYISVSDPLSYTRYILPICH